MDDASTYGSFSAETEKSHVNGQASKCLKSSADETIRGYRDTERSNHLRINNDVNEKSALSCEKSIKKTVASEERTNDVNKQPKKSMSRRQLLVIVCLSCGNFCVAACFGILAPFFPQEAERKGVDSTIVGLIFGEYQLVIFLATPIIGYLIPKLGAKFTLVSGLFLSSGCTMLFGFLDMEQDVTVYISLCFACRTLEAIGSAMFATASFTIVACEFPGQETTYIGVVEVFMSIGFMISPVIGGVLHDAGGFVLPFVVLGGVMFVCSLLTFIILPVDNYEPESVRGSMFQLVRKPSILIICFAIMTCAITLGVLDPVFAAYLDEVHGEPLSSTVKGVIFLCLPCAYCLTTPVVGILNDKFGGSKLMMIMGCFLMFVSFMLIGPSPLLHLPKRLWLVVSSTIPMGVGLAISVIPTFKEMLHRAKLFIGPSFGGYLNHSYGFQWASTILSFFFLAVTIFVAGFFCIFSKVNKDATTVTNFSPLDEEMQTLSIEVKDLHKEYNTDANISGDEDNDNH